MDRVRVVVVDAVHQVQQHLNLISYHHFPLIAYSVLIVSFLSLILTNYTRVDRFSASISTKVAGSDGTASKRTNRMLATVFILLSVWALVATWTYMLLFFERSFFESALRSNVRPSKFTVERWLASTMLFEEAWLQVCATSERWWWSEQLCIFTVMMSIFMRVEARRSRIKKPTAFIFFAYLVAVSVSLSLFLSVLCLSSMAPRMTKERRMDDTIAQRRLKLAVRDTARPSYESIFAVTIAFFTIALTPLFVPTPYFLINLIIMHVVLIIPLLPSSFHTQSHLSYSELYLAIAFVSVVARYPTYAELITLPITLSSLEGFARDQIGTFFSLPSQASISYDVVFSTGIFCFWMMVAVARKDSGSRVTDVAILLLLLTTTPMVGIGGTGAVFLGWRESWTTKTAREELVLQQQQQKRK